MLTFHRSQTPSCFYPNRAALSLPASQHHFCCLHSTSSLSLAAHCLSWRDSMHLGGGDKYWKKPKQPKKQQLFDFPQTLAAFAEVPEEMAEWAWIRQSSPRRKDFITWPHHSWQGKDAAHAPGEDKNCTSDIAFKAVYWEGTCSSWQYHERDLYSPSGWTTSQSASYRCLSVLNLSPSFLWSLPWKVFLAFRLCQPYGDCRKKRKRPNERLLSDLR